MTSISLDVLIAGLYNIFALNASSLRRESSTRTAGTVARARRRRVHQCRDCNPRQCESSTEGERNNRRSEDSAPLRVRWKSDCWDARRYRRQGLRACQIDVELGPSAAAAITLSYVCRAMRRVWKMGEPDLALPESPLDATLDLFGKRKKSDVSRGTTFCIWSMN